MPDRAFTFVDGFHGPTCIDGASLGDFPIQKADGTPAYQLACAVDDAETGITQVVRGDDLLDSTPRQIALLEALGLASRIPTYTHLPLVIGTDGRRLAKRHGDTRLSAYRNAGRSASEVLLLLAGWCGVETEAKAPPRRADDLVAGFDLGRLSRECVVYDAGADPLLQNRTT